MRNPPKSTPENRPAARPSSPLYAVVAVEFSGGARRHVAVPCPGADQRIVTLEVIAYGSEE